jgi:hypothetical protein
MTYFTLGPADGSDPHVYEVHGLLDQPHTWDTPHQDPIAHQNQLLLNQALLDAQSARDAAGYATAPQIALPEDPSTWHLPTRQEVDEQWERLRQADWERRCPIRARFYRWLNQ